MRLALLGLCLLTTVLSACAPQPIATSPVTLSASAEQEVLALSRAKWLWMADRNVDSLTALFHDEAVFVHMGGTWGKAQELEIIRSGGIHYKQATVHDVVADVVDDTAVLWSRITLVAALGTNEVTTEFTVTEVYKRQDDAWKMLALTFSSVRPGATIAR